MRDGRGGRGIFESVGEEIIFKRLYLESME